MPDIDVGQFSEALNDKADRDLNNTQPFADYVIESKYPTAEDPTWYRLYKSGWLEQGGIVTVSANSQYNGTFAIEFKDTNICFLATDNDSALNGNVYGFQQGCGVSSNSTFYLRTAYDSSVKFSWRAEGMSAQEQS